MQREVQFHRLASETAWESIFVTLESNKTGKLLAGIIPQREQPRNPFKTPVTH
jgi:hypothetical protein